jgi:hypothetical protein
MITSSEYRERLSKMRRNASNAAPGGGLVEFRDTSISGKIHDAES